MFNKLGPGHQSMFWNNLRSYYFAAAFKFCFMIRNSYLSHLLPPASVNYQKSLIPDPNIKLILLLVAYSVDTLRL